MIIDKSSSTPIYIQLKNLLKQKIMAHEIQEGEAIPSETQLARQYAITRSTVRMAITELVNENLLRREHGKGTFVSITPLTHSMLNFGSFSEYFAKKDKIPVSQVLEAVTITYKDRNYFRLIRARGVQENEGIIYLTIDNSLLPLDIFPEINTFDFAHHSLYRVMRDHYNIAPERVELSITPLLASDTAPDVTSYFAMTEKEPLLRARGKVYSSGNQLIEKINVMYSPQIDFNLATRIGSHLA